MENKIIEYFYKNGYSIESVNNKNRYKYSYHYHFSKGDIIYSIFQLSSDFSKRQTIEICDVGKYGSWEYLFINDVDNIDYYINELENIRKNEMK